MKLDEMSLELSAIESGIQKNMELVEWESNGVS